MGVMRSPEERAKDYLGGVDKAIEVLKTEGDPRGLLRGAYRLRVGFVHACQIFGMDIAQISDEDNNI